MVRGELQRKAEELSRTQFVGARVERFEADGRLMFIALVRRGLTPDSHVIDVGCGALRAGYWLIHFLQPGHYHGIEPARERIDAARTALLEPGVEEQRRPDFAHNADFDLAGFGVAPDFVLARSIWSHTAKSQIVALLDSFAQVSRPGSLLFASYHPAGRRPRGYVLRHRLHGLRARWADLSQRRAPASEDASALEAAKSRRRARTERQRAAGYEGVWDLPDYQGSDWVTGDSGQAAHRFEFIEAECQARGLSVRETEQDGFGNQVWLEIRRPAD
jgi:SAM-dependent methyltransferase